MAALPSPQLSTINSFHKSVDGVEFVEFADFAEFVEFVDFVERVNSVDVIPPSTLSPFP
jgi:hypothetical protein